MKVRGQWQVGASLTARQLLQPLIYLILEGGRESIGQVNELINSECYIFFKSIAIAGSS